MKIDSTFRVFAFLMTVLIFSMPVIIFAQQNPTETKATIEAEARAQAVADAENDTNKTAWFKTGCFLNIIGVAMARRTKAPVPAGRLVGKSLTYIVAYTSAYQTRQTEIQEQSALSGCTVGTLVGCVAAFILVRKAVDDSLGSSYISGSSSGGGVSSNWCLF